MKKIEYQKPEVEVRTLNMEYLMAVSGKVDDEPAIDWGGEDDGTHEPGAKEYWDD